MATSPGNCGPTAPATIQRRGAEEPRLELARAQPVMARATCAPSRDDPYHHPCAGQSFPQRVRRAAAGRRVCLGFSKGISVLSCGAGRARRRLAAIQLTLLVTPRVSVRSPGVRVIAAWAISKFEFTGKLS